MRQREAQFRTIGTLQHDRPGSPIDDRSIEEHYQTRVRGQRIDDRIIAANHSNETFLAYGEFRHTAWRADGKNFACDIDIERIQSSVIPISELLGLRKVEERACSRKREDRASRGAAVDWPWNTTPLSVFRRQNRAEHPDESTSVATGSPVEMLPGRPKTGRAAPLESTIMPNDGRSI